MPRTIADGLQTTEPGRLTWEVGSQLVDEIVTVTDEQIVEAMRFAFERLKLVVEPSGAVGIAAVRAGLVAGGRIGVIVSGGNVGAARFAELLALSRTAFARLGDARALVAEPEELDHLVVELVRDPARDAEAVRLGAAGLDQHLADPRRERQVGPRLVQVPELALAEPELDAAEAVRMHGDALPRAHLPLDTRADILHACRSTSAWVTCRGSDTSCIATTARS